MRRTYLDNTRWITVVLVVLYHVIYIFNGIQTIGVIGPFRPVQYQDAFQYIVYPWFMLLLFVISGMSARFALEHQSAREFLSSRTRKLLVPSTIGLLVFGWATGYYNMMIGGAFEQMGTVPGPVLFLIMAVSGTGPLWYIQMLWLFSLLLLPFRKLEKDRIYSICEKLPLPVLLSFVLLIWGSANIGNTPIIVVYRFGIYGTGFLLGYLVFSHDCIMEQLEKWWVPLSIGAALIGTGFTVSFWGRSYADHEVLDTFACNLYAWVGTLAILATMKKWGNWQNSFSRWMGQHSWGLYLFHYLPLATCAWYLTKFTALPPLIVYCLTGAAAFGGAYLLYEVFSRIPILKWCLCGIGGKRK